MKAVKIGNKESIEAKIKKLIASILKVEIEPKQIKDDEDLNIEFLNPVKSLANYIRAQMTEN